MNLKLYLQNKLEKAIIGLWPKLKEQPITFDINYPPDVKFGDYSSNVAMKLAPVLHFGPMDIAGKVKDKIGRLPSFKQVEIVNPGFLNFYINEKWLSRQTGTILKEKKQFGKAQFGKNKKVQVEFISANPTGPLHLGNGRGGFAGDTLSNVLKLAGYRVQREYYINDIGNQVGILAESVLRRYWQHKGIKSELPDYCYKGKYVDDLAKKLFLPNYTLKNTGKIEEVREKIKGRILQKMISNIKKLTEKKLGIKYDRWFFEHTLYSSGTVDKILKFLKERGLLYKSEGAIWLRTSKFGDDKDRVLIKADKDPVYFLSDIAYHWNKFAKRKFDKVIDIWGADHHGYVGRVQAAMEIFNFAGQLDIIITQLVRLVSKGQEIKMSKRSGTFVTLEELIDEVGLDAARFFFLMYDFNTHMDFDLDLAKKKSKDNPVYYVQYAHARICSIIRKVKLLKTTRSDNRAILEVAEVCLIKTLMKWPELILEVSQNYQVNKLPFYATEVATVFHDFYTKCRVINGKLVNERRLNIIKATQVVLQNVLSTMGIGAPERM
jgi:arginyl-tRNA synthetase